MTFCSGSDKRASVIFKSPTTRIDGLVLGGGASLRGFTSRNVLTQPVRETIAVANRINGIFFITVLWLIVEISAWSTARMPPLVVALLFDGSRRPERK